MQTITIPGGEVRIYPAQPGTDDRSDMYVLDVLGHTLLIRQRPDGTFVHVDTDGYAPNAALPVAPLIVEVNNGGENVYGDAS
jgi:hypothetical protein